MIDEILKALQFIPRPLYTDRIKPFMDKEIIKVITQRRVGKSYILFQLIQEIRQKNPNCNIIYINKELKPHQYIYGDAQPYDHVKSQLKQNTLNYLFVDEIQETKGFEKALRIQTFKQQRVS